MKAYAVIPMPLQNDINKWIKIIIPLDAYDITEKTEWVWNSIEKDAFSLKLGTCKSFRNMARLLGENIVFDMNTCSWDLRNCRELNYSDIL